MEANLSLAVRIFVGGLVGHIFSPDRGRLVGGCVGAVPHNEAERRQVGGCVACVYEPGVRRFVGGCIGAIPVGASPTRAAGRPAARPRREARATWGEAVVAEPVR